MRVLLALLMAFSPLAASAQGPGRIVSGQAARQIGSAVQGQVTWRLTKPTLKVNGRVAGANLGLSPGGGYMAVGLRPRGVALWDVEGGREVARLSTDREMTVVAASDQGAVAAAAPDGAVWLLGRDGKRAVAAAGRPVTALAFDASGAELTIARDDGAIESRRLADGQTTLSRRHSTPLVRVAARSGALLGVSAAGEVVRTDGTAAEGVQATKTRGLAAVAQAALSPDGRSAYAVDAGGALTRIDIAAANARRLDVKLRDVAQLAIPANTDFAVTLNRAGEVELIRLKDGKRAATLISTASGWAVLDYEGRYDGSNDAMSDIVWQAGPNSIDLQAFAERYFEPGVLSKYVRGASLRPVPANLAEGVAAPPKVEVVLPADVPKAAGPGYQVVVLATDGGGGVNGLRLYHNGRLVPPDSLVQVQDLTAGGKKVRAAAFAVSPTAGLNSFRAVATAAFDMEAYSERVSAEYAGPQAPVTQHVLAVGVDDYDGPLPDLDFATKDAGAIAEHFRAAPKGRLTRRSVTLLTDAKATKAAILAELRRIAGQSAASDIVVIYLAGHGFSPAPDVWRFAPSGANVTGANLAATTLLASELEGALASSKAQRVLLMIDACQSTAAFGAFVDQREFYRRFFADLSRTEGFGVLSAARADADAIELRRLGHGAFTFVVLDGLRGAADAAPMDRRVSVLELANFVETRLPEVSFQEGRMRQVPGAFSLGADFILD